MRGVHDFMCLKKATQSRAWDPFFPKTSWPMDEVGVGPPPSDNEAACRCYAPVS